MDMKSLSVVNVGVEYLRIRFVSFGRTADHSGLGDRNLGVEFPRRDFHAGLRLLQLQEIPGKPDSNDEAQRRPDSYTR